MRLLTALLLSSLLVGCQRDSNKTRSDATKDTAKTDTVRKAIFPEPEALGVLRAVNDAEIAMARMARDISRNDVILDYANVMMADHGGLQQLITAPARDNGMSTRLRAASDSLIAAMRLMPSGFNNTYIEEEVKAHRQALQLLDTVIVPSVRDANVRNVLVQVRPTMVAHLQRAMQILSLRRREAADRGEAWESGVPANQPTAEPAAEEPADELVGEPVVAPTVTPPVQTPTPKPVPQPQPADTTRVPPTTTTNM